MALFPHLENCYPISGTPVTHYPEQNTLIPPFLLAAFDVVTSDADITPRNVAMLLQLSD